jgi:DNA invertase Pin-like site-specific DNA recombinase
LVLNKQEKKELVIKLANEGKTAREIAQLAHVSLRDIGEIIRKAVGDDESSGNDEHKQDRKSKNKTIYAQCFEMFKNGKPLIDIVIELDMEAATVRRIYLII